MGFLCGLACLVAVIAICIACNQYDDGKHRERMADRESTAQARIIATLSDKYETEKSAADRWRENWSDLTTAIKKKDGLISTYSRVNEDQANEIKKHLNQLATLRSELTVRTAENAELTSFVVAIGRRAQTLTE